MLIFIELKEQSLALQPQIKLCITRVLETANRYYG